MIVYQLAILTVAPGVAPGDPPSATVLVSASDLTPFAFYQRSSAGEVMTFMSKTVSERTEPAQRQSVQENIYTAHCYNRDNLSAVVITDHEYPVRVAFSILNKVLDEFSTSVPADSYSNPSSISFPALSAYLNQYQDPKQADNIMRVQQELDETKIILHKTIESVLQRGERLDDLVDRSNALSQTSKMFYTTAKKQNSCCVIM